MMDGDGFNTVGDALARAVEDKAVGEVAVSLADVASQVDTLNRFVEDLTRRTEVLEYAVRVMFWMSVLYGVVWLVVGGLWLVFR